MGNLMNERLKGKIVAITGGARGNGLATAIRVGKEGASVFIGDIDEEKASDMIYGMLVMSESSKKEILINPKKPKVLSDI